MIGLVIVSHSHCLARACAKWPIKWRGAVTIAAAAVCRTVTPDPGDRPHARARRHRRSLE
ncbi:MAG: hypothetical protein R2856_01400 [Caldilineaceae bacterium]